MGASATQSATLGYQHKEVGKEKPNPLDQLDWAGHRFNTPKDLAHFIESARVAARTLDTYLSSPSIFDRIRSAVRVGDRVAHIDALCRSASEDSRDPDLLRAITRCVTDWHGTPAVEYWCQQNLMRVVSDLLPNFSLWLSYGESSLPELLEKCGIPDSQICAALLDGMERHVDRLSAASVYALIGLVGRYCTEEEAALVAARYAARLVQRIPSAERDVWDISAIPTNPTEGIARFLYALLGDVDVRSRWRAAHSLRLLARLGEIDTLNEVARLYDRMLEPGYRKPDAPFYWLAARLWLLISLSRIAEESPSALKDIGQGIFEIVTDDAFPHVLLRNFAKSAVSKLLENGVLNLDVSQRQALARVNTSPIRRKKGNRSYERRFDKYRHQVPKERRFRFNTIDTLPYWYDGAVKTFADLDGNEFLDRAEQWIVDRWGERNNPWQWDAEPRQARLENRSLSAYHGHGSRPVLERYHTYLEWHAMWCATGELMRTHALARGSDNDSYGSFEHWLKQDELTTAPLWLADLRGPKPLEDRFWFAPQGDIDGWVEDVGDNDFLAELELLDENETIVVEGSQDTRSRNFQLSTRVHTALVSPDTAAALVRALQTTGDSWAYRIPPAGDELEIEVPPYKLVGWLVDGEGDVGIDQHDPLRYQVRKVESRPSKKTEKTLGLKLIYDGRVRWIQANSGTSVHLRRMGRHAR